MPPGHLLLALTVVAVWGTNFVVIKAGLDSFPPLLFATLRFALALFPAFLFLSRPKVSLTNLATYGVLTGAGQFGLLYLAMRGSISPGLASLCMQMHVFFTIGLSVWLAGETVRGYQVIALGVAASGLLIVAGHTHTGSVTLYGLLLVMGAALSWAGANLLAKRAAGADMLAYVVWSSAFAIPVLLALSWVTEGPDAIARSLREAPLTAWGAVVWQSWANTLFGFAAWGWLLGRHAAANVAPTALLVPIFGMAASAGWLGEDLPAWKITAAALVLTGLIGNLFYPRLRGSSPPAPARRPGDERAPS